MSPAPSPSEMSIPRGAARLIACRECRKSKVRCSRTVPCEACTRRGCGDICPDGLRDRRIKSDETLIEKNARLVRRILYLEGILASMNHPEGLNPTLYGEPNHYDESPPSTERHLSEEEEDKGYAITDPEAGPLAYHLQRLNGDDLRNQFDFSSEATFAMNFRSALCRDFEVNNWELRKISPAPTEMNDTISHNYRQGSIPGQPNTPDGLRDIFSQAGYSSRPFAEAELWKMLASQSSHNTGELLNNPNIHSFQLDSQVDSSNIGPYSTHSQLLPQLRRW